MGRMFHFGMKLYRVHAALRVGHGRDGRVGGVADHAKARRQPLDPIAMTHPHPAGRRLRHSFGADGAEQPVLRIDQEIGLPEFPPGGLGHEPSQHLGE